MNALPDNYNVMKRAIHFTGVVLIYNIITIAIETRELKLKAIKGKKQGKHGSKNKGNQDTSEQKTKEGNMEGENRKCFHYGMVGHLKDCLN